MFYIQIVPAITEVWGAGKKVACFKSGPNWGTPEVKRYKGSHGLVHMVAPQFLEEGKFWNVVVTRLIFA